MNKKLLGMLLLLTGSCIGISCTDEEQPNPNKGEDNPQETTSKEIYYANMLGKDIMSELYYWNEDIAADLAQWNIETNEDPIGTVDRIRYHKGDKYIDKWTMMTDDMNSFTSSVEGVSTTYGWNLAVYRFSNSDDCFAVINYVSPDSPAEKAGLKRGDILLTLGDEDITVDNYLDLYYSTTLTSTLGAYDAATNTISFSEQQVTLHAINMYENPILCDTVYEFNGKKVGYLAYTSFDLNSIPKLVEIGKKFKSEGIKELVLDLRYNGGGYVITESVLASMFAPKANVDAGDIFEKEQYNAYLTEAYQQAGVSLETPFTTEFNYDDIGLHISTKDANIGLERIYGLISPNTASASEALLSGLMPYMDIRLIGQASHGKYCTGLMMSGEDSYENCPEEIKNWGVYVMVSIYQNALGETPCMPDGLQPDTEAIDDPMQPYQLGDVDEAMLRAALTEAGRHYETSDAGSRSLSPASRSRLEVPQKPIFGKRILLPPASLKTLKPSR